MKNEDFDFRIELIKLARVQNATLYNIYPAKLIDTTDLELKSDLKFRLFIQLLFDFKFSRFYFNLFLYYCSDYSLNKTLIIIIQ